MMTTPAVLKEHTAIAVGLGEYYISREPDEALVAYGLGSCVAVAVYDPPTRTGGLLHAVLPQPLPSSEANAAKYVSSGIEALLREFRLRVTEYPRLQVWLVGGANMLFSAPSMARTWDIGDRNIAAAQETLARLKLKIRAQAVGGNVGRTVRLFIADGRLTMRVIGSPESVL